MASFLDIFRPSAPFAAIITSFQDGLYEDVVAYITTFRRHACEHPRNFKQRPLVHEATIYPSRLQPGAALDMDCVDLFLQTGDIGRQAFTAPIHYAVAQGHVEIVLRALACRPQQLSVELIACALAHGHAELTKHLLAKKDRLDPTRVPRTRTTSVEARVAARDSPELFVLLKVFAPKINWINALASAIQARAASAAMYIYSNHGSAAVEATTMDAVCTMGLLALATQMHSDGQRCTPNAMNGAAVNGHLEVVRFLHEHRHEGCFPHTLARVAAQGHTNVLAYLVTHVVAHNAHFYAPAIDSASSLATLQILQAAVPGRVSLQTLASALDSGSTDYVATLLRAYDPVFRAALSARTSLVDGLLVKACGPNGSVALVQLLDDYCRSLSLAPPRLAREPIKNAVHAALSFGHADIAAYLSARGYHWRHSTFNDETMAAVCGHANAAASVAFLLQENVEMDSGWANAACRYGSWLGVAACVVAAATSRVSMQWLLHAARGAGINVVATLRSTRVQPPTATDIVDVGSALPEVLSYLYATYPVTCRSDEVVHSAVRRGRTRGRFLRFLVHQNMCSLRSIVFWTARFGDAPAYRRLSRECFRDATDPVDTLLFVLSLGYKVATRGAGGILPEWLAHLLSVFDAVTMPPDETVLRNAIARHAATNASAVAFMTTMRTEGLWPFNWLLRLLEHDACASYLRHILTLWEALAKETA